MPTLAGKIEEEIAPFVREYGCEVVKVSILEQNRNKILQVLIEKIDGNSANINDCQIVSRALSLKLDVMNITNVDTIGVDVLPHLATQYHITGKEGWIFCKTVQEKRNFIKNSIKLHATRGTKYAILKALEILNIDAKLIEWFE